MTDTDADAGTDAEESVPTILISSERAKAFVDAVVAIAMTLLILPLIELVTGGDEEIANAGDWIADHQWPLISFVLTFALIGMFWLNHHRLFAGVERVSTPLLWINIAWLLTIVWLPVATALIGRTDDDPVAAITYVGTMIVTSALMLAMRLYLRAHPSMHSATESALRNGIAVDLSMMVLFGVALAINLATPLGYFGMFAMALTGPLQAVFARLLRANRVDAAR